MKKIGFNKLLNEYGPEGLYLISSELKRIADNDVYNALNQMQKPCRGCCSECGEGYDNEEG